MAVAAGYAPLAIGAEFDGSIIAPAAVAGVVGLKPTVGLIRPEQLHPHLDLAGRWRGGVNWTLAIALEVLAGIDPDDPGGAGAGAAHRPLGGISNSSEPSPTAGGGDYTSGLAADALQGVRNRRSEELS